MTIVRPTPLQRAWNWTSLLRVHERYGKDVGLTRRGTPCAWLALPPSRAKAIGLILMD